MSFDTYITELGLSQTRLAKALDVSPHTVRGYAKSCPKAVLECMAAWVAYKRRLEQLGLVVKAPPKRGTPRKLARG